MRWWNGLLRFLSAAVYYSLTLLVLVLWGLWTGLRRNRAKRPLRRLIAALGALNPQVIARVGDAGLGIDNTRPWYHYYVTVDLVPELDDLLRSAARDLGFDAEIGKGYVDAFAGSSLALDPTASHLNAWSGGRSLRANVSRGTEVPVYAYGRGIEWGTKVAPQPGRAIVSLSMHLPDVRARVAER